MALYNKGVSKTSIRNFKKYSKLNFNEDLSNKQLFMYYTNTFISERKFLDEIYNEDGGADIRINLNQGPKVIQGYRDNIKQEEVGRKEEFTEWYNRSSIPVFYIFDEQTYRDMEDKLVFFAEETLVIDVDEGDQFDPDAVVIKQKVYTVGNIKPFFNPDGSFAYAETLLEQINYRISSTTNTGTAFRKEIVFTMKLEIPKEVKYIQIVSESIHLISEIEIIDSKSEYVNVKKYADKAEWDDAKADGCNIDQWGFNLAYPSIGAGSITWFMPWVSELKFYEILPKSFKYETKGGGAVHTCHINKTSKEKGTPTENIYPWRAKRNDGGYLIGIFGSNDNDNDWLPTWRYADYTMPDINSQGNIDDSKYDAVKKEYNAREYLVWGPGVITTSWKDEAVEDLKWYIPKLSCHGDILEKPRIQLADTRPAETSVPWVQDQSLYAIDVFDSQATSNASNRLGFALSDPISTQEGLKSARAYKQSLYQMGYNRLYSKRPNLVDNINYINSKLTFLTGPTDLNTTSYTAKFPSRLTSLERLPILKDWDGSEQEYLTLQPFHTHEYVQNYSLFSDVASFPQNFSMASHEVKFGPAYKWTFSILDSFNSAAVQTNKINGTWGLTHDYNSIRNKRYSIKFELETKGGVYPTLLAIDLKSWGGVKYAFKYYDQFNEPIIKTESGTPVFHTIRSASSAINKAETRSGIIYGEVINKGKKKVEPRKTPKTKETDRPIVDKPIIDKAKVQRELDSKKAKSCIHPILESSTRVRDNSKVVKLTFYKNGNVREAIFTFRNRPEEDNDLTDKIYNSLDKRTRIIKGYTFIKQQGENYEYK